MFQTMNQFYSNALICWIIFSVLTFIILLTFKPYTYGRHINSSKFSIDNKLGWFVMELPTVILMPYIYFKHTTEYNIVVIVFIILYFLHYTNRVFIYPFRINTNTKKIPILIVVAALLFNICKTYFIGYYFSKSVSLYDLSWFYSPFFIVGFIIFLLGAIINNQSDTILINLRKGSETGYKVPYGGLFKYVSCPNHLGEIIEWIGFAILTCSLPTLAFALWTMANLIPRSIEHHKWYIKKFQDYPNNRKAIIPYLI